MPWTRARTWFVGWYVGYCFLQSARDFTHEKGPGVRQDEVDFGVEIGSPALSNVDEQDGW
jgi:hypothetical protein